MNIRNFLRSNYATLLIYFVHFLMRNSADEKLILLQKLLDIYLNAVTFIYKERKKICFHKRQSLHKYYKATLRRQNSKKHLKNLSENGLNAIHDAYEDISVAKIH